jgi:uncharacterized protein
MPTRSEVRRDLYGSKPREMRMVAARTEVREDSPDSFAFSGYASVTDAAYPVTDWLGEYTETIARGAFSKSLQESDDVRLLVNHEGVPLARTRSGTLALREVMKPEDDPQGRGQTGLWCEANIDASSPLAQTIRSAMARGDMDQMSFAFQVTRQEWNKDYTERTVNEVKLFDASIVTYPASPITSAQLNSEKVAGIAARMASKRALTDPDDVATITQLLGVLSAIDDIVDAKVDETADYLGVASPASPDEPDEGDMPDMPAEPMRAADPDVEARAKALALAKARARAHK